MCILRVSAALDIRILLQWLRVLFLAALSVICVISHGYRKVFPSSSPFFIMRLLCQSGIMWQSVGIASYRALHIALN